MSDAPSTNGDNGRQAGGRFAQGNAGGPGNPHAKRVAKLRTALFKAVSPDDLKAVVAALLASAKGGDVAAARELLQRLLGPPEAIDFVDRLEALEQNIASAQQRGQTW